MHRTILILLTFLTANTFIVYMQSFAESNKIDSLLAELKTSKEDTTKIKLYLKIGNEYTNTILDSALYFYKKALKLSQSPPEVEQKDIYIKLKTKSLNYIGIVHYYQGNYASAIEYYKKVLKIFEESGNKNGISGCYNNIGLAHDYQGNYASAIKYYRKALKIYKELGNKKGISYCYTNIGNIHYYQGNYANAIDYYKKSLKIAKELGSKKEIATCYNNIGLVHDDQGNYAIAIKYYQKSLKIFEESDDKKGMSMCYNNIGLVHYYQGNYASAIDYYKKSLKIAEELGDKKGIANCYNNIGLVYDEQGNSSSSKKLAADKYARAIEYYQKSLKIFEESDDKKGMSMCYMNIGIVYEEQGYSASSEKHAEDKYISAIEYYQKSLKIKEKLGDKKGIAMVLGNIANLNNTLADSLVTKKEKTEKYYKAIKLAGKALRIAKEIKTLPLEKEFLIHLSNSYEGLKNYKKALEFHKLYMEANDSLFNEEKNKQITQMEAHYQAEKKQQEIEKQKILLEKKDVEVKQQEAVASRQRMQRNAFIGGFALMLILAVVVLRSYRQKKKANILLSEQKEEIGQKNEELQQQKEEITVQRDELEQTNEKLDETNKQLELKNKDVTDSINYAKRIQTAILPPEEYVTKSLPEHFILFKPRDIVSGDFYWATVKNNSLIIAAVDCTGHGVPGAFMSMLGVSFLNEIVNKLPVETQNFASLQANEILNQLRDEVINSLHQTGKEDEAQDGMDIALYILNMETKELRYAGANNPLYIVRNKNLTGFQNLSGGVLKIK